MPKLLVYSSIAAYLTFTYADKRRRLVELCCILCVVRISGISQTGTVVSLWFPSLRTHSFMLQHSHALTVRSVAAQSTLSAAGYASPKFTKIRLLNHSACTSRAERIQRGCTLDLGPTSTLSYLAKCQRNQTRDYVVVLCFVIFQLLEHGRRDQGVNIIEKCGK